MSDQRLVEVYRAKNSLQAHMFRSALEEVGIKASIHEGNSPTGDWTDQPMHWSVAPRITVLEQDLETARELLLRLEKRERSGEST